MMEAMKKAFETIAMAKVATSAHEARGFGFLSNSDRITMNRERVLSDAKARALELARAGYEPPMMRTDIPAPGENILAALKMGVHLMRQGDFISDHEQKLAGKSPKSSAAATSRPARRSASSMCSTWSARRSNLSAEKRRRRRESSTR